MRHSAIYDSAELGVQSQADVTIWPKYDLGNYAMRLTIWQFQVCSSNLCFEIPCARLQSNPKSLDREGDAESTTSQSSYTVQSYCEQSVGMQHYNGQVGALTPSFNVYVNILYVFRNGMCGGGSVSKSRADVQSQSDPDSAFKTEAFSETIEATEHQVLRSPSAV